MDNRFNTIAGWGLFAATCALGLSIGSGMFFSSHAPEKPGYPIEDAESGSGSGAAAVPIANLLAAADAAKGETIFAKCSACHTINQGGLTESVPICGPRSAKATAMSLASLILMR